MARYIGPIQKKLRSLGLDRFGAYNERKKVSTTFSRKRVSEYGLQLIEKQMGRIHAKLNDVYESRIIDLDILFFDTVLLKTHQLTIPHIHLYDRNYVLIPFHEIEPNFKCPVKKDTICNLLKLCQDKSKVNLYPH